LSRVVDAANETRAWIYVTPYPASVSSGNCRFAFDHLPPGRYRLNGWHPFEGTRARWVMVGHRGAIRLTPLLYGATAAHRRSK
jgi:hypothetical protein